MADGGIGFILGAFEGEEHVTSDRKGIVEGFEAGGKGGPLGVAEIAGDTAEGQDEVIVGELAVVENDMVTQVIVDKVSPEAAVDEANKRIKEIYDRLPVK